MGGWLWRCCPFWPGPCCRPVLNRAAIDALGAQARAALGLLGAQVTETVQGLSDLLAFQAAGRRRVAFAAVLDAYADIRHTLLADLTRQTVLQEMATALGGLAVALAGAALVQRGAVPQSVLPLLVLVSVAAFLPVSEIAQVGRQLADTLAATGRLRLVHNEPVRITDGPRVLPKVHGGSAIAFENVRFAYPGPAADGAGRRVVPGPARRACRPGRGVRRRQDHRGQPVAALLGPAIRADHARRRALPELPQDALRSRVALVAQDTYLFNDTLEANIRLAKPDATPEELDRAIARAALARFVAGLPQGLATRVGERGVQLSGGQRQRIAIARAFLKDAPVLVLDEATSHLDAISEAQVKMALEALMTERTTLVIAHRLSTIRGADLILRDGGRPPDRVPDAMPSC